MLRLLTDERLSLDPVGARALPAHYVWALFDAIALKDEATRREVRWAEREAKG